MNTSFSPRNAPPPPSQPATAPPQSGRRLPVQPPTITTALTAAQRLGARLHPHTPNSAGPPSTPFSVLPASPVASPASASASMPPARTVSAATATYNPQEWARHSHSSGGFIPHPSPSSVRRVGPREATGMEANLPSPPPPYSASPQASISSARANRSSPNSGTISSMTTSPTSYASEHTTPVSAATSVTSVSSASAPSSAFRSGSATPGQTHASQATFPPPPPPSHPRDRSSSRSRFNLSVLTSRSRANNYPSPSSAMETLQQQTYDAIARAPASSPYNSSPSSSVVVPPSARRAASTGCIGPSGGAERRSSATTTPVSAVSSNHGFSLPPPPPGPPPGSPPSARSQSMNRVGELERHQDINQVANGVASAVTRWTASRSQLGPIPPTPADWVEPDTQSGGAMSMAGPEQQQSSYHLSQEDVPALRGIRERRSESRAGRDQSSTRDLQATVGAERGIQTAEGDSARPANLVLGQATGGISRRRHVSKSKISPLFNDSPSPSSTRAPPTSDDSQMSESNPGSVSASHDLGMTPIPTTSQSAKTKGNSLYSQGRGSDRSSFPPSGPSSPALGKKSLIQSFKANAPAGFHPVTHSPTEEMSAILGATSPRPASRQRRRNSGTSDHRDAFAQASLERHLRFVDMESSAQSDFEKLQLFADFIVTESRLRRNRYANAFEKMGSDVLELTRDLWRPLEGFRRPELPTLKPTDSRRHTPGRNSQDDSGTSQESPSTGSNPQSASFTPKTEPGSPLSASSQSEKLRSDPQQNKGSFQPCLSPIPSMAMSTIPDETDSRGRAASRWFEASAEGDSVGNGRRVERSKRESKYMGLPKEAREHLQWSDPELQPRTSPGLEPSQLGPKDYPPEKVGWHESEPPASSPGFTRVMRRPSHPDKLDVSRLVTLPPPYPRHHPAVNNNHPDLSALRSTLRLLNDEKETIETRQHYDVDATTNSLRPESPSVAAERRRNLRRRIQEQVSQGAISFAEAAREEAVFETGEQKRSRNQAKKAFDHFQSMVLGPLNAIYSGKIARASAAMDQLGESLSYDARSQNPNQTQEEGDEQPELLEKLTLMKWFHEAREQLHRDQFALEGDSDTRYKSMILAPYQQTGNHEKVREVESFFSKDSQERKSTFEQNALKRMESFLKTVEDHVTRGAETQLSAFWDIAPPLHAIIQRVPLDLDGFEIAIPPEEYEENPSYHEFPTQYLYSLLEHAGKSAYQFIESQTNLLCLLHEVRTGNMKAGCRLLETQRMLAGEEKSAVEQEMLDIRQGEDATLTSDLKERVGLVEEQWRQALGKGLEELEDRIKTFLFESGGWDESLED